MNHESSSGLSGWESMLGSLFDQSPGFMALLEGSDHVFRLANRSYRRLVGSRPLLDRSVRDVFPELADSGLFELLDEVFQSGVPYVGRAVRLELDSVGTQAGSEHYVDFVYQPIVTAAGAIQGIFCQGHEVTDRVLAERDLKAKADELTVERQVFNTALTFSEDFNYVFETDGRFSFVNKPLLELWGMTLAEAKGKTFRELPYASDLAERLMRQIAQVVRTAVQVRDQTFYRGPSGKGGWFEYIFNPVFDGSGAVAAVAGSTRDITSRVESAQEVERLMESERLARSAAERASRVKDEFLATLSHELRTPLNSMMGWADLLRSGRLTQDKAAHAVERIIYNGKAQAQLISDLLDVNGIAAGKVRLSLESLPLSLPLYGALDAVMPDATAKGLIVVPPVFDPDLQAWCDPNRLQQVLWNILSNALKFTPSGGTIALSVTTGDDVIRVAVVDSGCGIDPVFLPRLFDRFSQADSSSTRQYSGLGLGLSICKTLIEMHGGTIEASSAGIGQGAAFFITLPRARASDRAAAPSKWGQSDWVALPEGEETSCLQGIAALVVDDDEEGRSLVRQLLQQYGMKVVEADSAEAAFEALDGSSFALLVCDVGMPLKDGCTMLRELRASEGVNRSIPAVALTAFARPEDERSALDSGFDAYLSKPAEPAAIVRACLVALGRIVAA